MLGDYDYIFVLTYGRSGSTLLMKLINSIEGVDINGENNNACLHLFRAINGIDRAKAKQDGAMAEPDHPWHGLERSDAEAFRQSLTESFVRDVLAPLPGTRTTGFKEVRHHPRHMTASEFSGYVDFLLTAFPRSKIVFNTRDAEAVASSGWYKDLPRDTVIERITAATQWFREIADSRDRCHVIDYSEVAGGGKGLPELFAFLQAPYDQARTDAILGTRLTHMKNTTGSQGAVGRLIRKITSKGK